MKKTRLLIFATLLLVMAFAGVSQAQYVATYSATVVNPSQEPIPGADVAVEWANSTIAATTTTDANGEFTLEFTEIPTEPGGADSLPIIMVITHPEYQMYNTILEIEEGDNLTGDVITMTPEATFYEVNGLVADTEGAPIYNATVYFRGQDGQGSYGADTFEDGTFQMFVTEGAYLVECVYYYLDLYEVRQWYDGVDSIDDATPVVVTQDVSGIDFELEMPALEPVATYGGTVIDQDSSQPVSGVAVSAFGADPVTTDANGEFLLEFFYLTNSDSNTVEIEFSHPDYLTHVETVAIAEGDNILDQTIEIAPIPPQHTVSGTVVDENGNPIPEAILFFHRTDGNDFQQMGYTDDNGQFMTSIYEGNYYIKCIALIPDSNALVYVTMWYDNVINFADATLVPVFDDVSGIDFTITGPTLGTVTGTVYDQATNEPLSGATIWIQSPDTGDSVYVQTGPNGQYTAQFYSMNPFYVLCEAPGYIPLFYEQAEEYFDATLLTIDPVNPTVTADFYMYTESAEGNNTLGGNIFDWSEQTAIEGATVVAMSEQHTFWTTANSGGDYVFNQLPDGVYFVFATEEDYIPRFYVQRWEDTDPRDDSERTPVELNGNDSVFDIDVALPALDEFGALVMGEVQSTEAEWLNGAVVTAYDQSGLAMSGSVSIQNGQFAMTGLHNGSYTLKASRVGYADETYFEEITIDLNEDTAVSGIVFEMIPQTLSVDDAVQGQADFTLSQSYPNPFNPATGLSTIRYQLPQATPVNISIYNAAGQRIRTLVDSPLPAGSYEIRWDGRGDQAQSVAAGVYFYRIKTPESSQTRRLVLMR